MFVMKGELKEDTGVQYSTEVQCMVQQSTPAPVRKCHRFYEEFVCQTKANVVRRRDKLKV